MSTVSQGRKHSLHDLDSCQCQLTVGAGMVQAEYQPGDGTYLLTATLNYYFMYSPEREGGWQQSLLAPVDPRMVTCNQIYDGTTVEIAGPAPLSVHSECSDDGQAFVESSQISMMVRYLAFVPVHMSASVFLCLRACVYACVCAYVCVRAVHCRHIMLNSRQRLSDSGACVAVQAKAKYNGESTFTCTLSQMVVGGVYTLNEVVVSSRSLFANNGTQLPSRRRTLLVTASIRNLQSSSTLLAMTLSLYSTLQVPSFHK